MDDEDIVVTVLRGLPSEFAAIKMVIRAQFVSCSMGELQTLLKAAEVDIENELGTLSALPLTAMVATQYGPSTMSTAQAQASTSNASSSTPSVPPGFTQLPQSSPTSYTLIPAMPYGFNPFHPYTAFDHAPVMIGYFSAKGVNRFNKSGNAMGMFHNSGHNFGNRGNFHPSNNSSNGGGFNRNNNGGSSHLMTCQIRGRVDHDAKTCKTLNNYSLAQGNNNEVYQYSGKNNHTADICFFIIGFPNQQSQQQTNLLGNATGNAMLDAATNPP